MHRDARAEKLVDLVLDYSIEIKKEDRFIVQFNPSQHEYANMFGRKARALGAEVVYDPMTFDPLVLRGLVERFDMDEWQEELARRKKLALWCNTRVLIDTETDSDYAVGVQDSKLRVAKLNEIIIGPYKEILYRPGENNGSEVRWNIVGFSSPTNAKNLGMSHSQHRDFVYQATLGNDWKKMGEDMKIIKKVFDNAKCVDIFVKGLTDLSFSLDGRCGHICDGKHNMPDGEVFYCPCENSVEGKVYFQHPAKLEGFGIMKGIELELNKGEIISSSAKENSDSLRNIIAVDAGSRRFGEFGIGCNYAIKRPIFETLFDEKIGGTIHLAIGNSLGNDLSEGGGKNNSNMHWDIVCDLRRDSRNLEEFPGGEIRVDSTVVQRNGKWLI